MDEMPYDPTTDMRCNYQMCEQPVDVRCPICGWGYCDIHWTERMERIHQKCVNPPTPRPRLSRTLGPWRTPASWKHTDADNQPE